MSFWFLHCFPFSTVSFAIKRLRNQFATSLGQIREIWSGEPFAASLWLDLAWRFSDLEMTWLLYCSGAATPRRRVTSVKQRPASNVADYLSLCSRTIDGSVDRRQTTSTVTAHTLTAGLACPLLHSEIWRNTTLINDKFISVTVHIPTYAYHYLMQNRLQFLTI